MKGNYDEGFGREQHKTKWIKKDGENEAWTETTKLESFIFLGLISLVYLHDI